MTREQTTRRRTLQLIGVGVFGGLAGCSDLLDRLDSTETPDPDGVETPTRTQSPTATLTPPSTPPAEKSPSPTESVTLTDVPNPTDTPSPTPTATSTPVPTPTPTPEPVNASIQAQVSESRGQRNDQFGYAVAISDETALVGTPFDTETKLNQGAAFVFNRQDGDWVQAAKLLSKDPSADDKFGYAVDLSSDGTTALIGAPGDDHPGKNSGSAQIFSRTDEGWSHTTDLAAAEVSKGHEFGTSVSISDDGTTSLVGAPLDDTLKSEGGAAYVFDRSGESWENMARLIPKKLSNEDKFGTAVALDGNQALVGAPFTDNRDLNDGSAYVFTQVGDGWDQTGHLTSGEGDRDDNFGYSVAIDEGVAVIGAPFAEVNLRDQGTAYLYTIEDGTWSQTSRFTAGDASRNNQFGGSVSLSGSIAVIGAPSHSHSTKNQGAAYVYQLMNGDWSQQAELLAEDQNQDDEFGFSTSVSGRTALVGVPGRSTMATQDGTAFIFSL